MNLAAAKHFLRDAEKCGGFYGGQVMKWLIAEVERLTDRTEQVTLERDIAKLAIKYKNELIAGTVGSGELNITICNEGFATTAYNLSLATSGAPLTKNMLYDVVLVPKRQY